jgi:hypothetical protein
MKISTLVLSFVILILLAIILQKVNMEELINDVNNLIKKVVNISVKKNDTSDKKKEEESRDCIKEKSVKIDSSGEESTVQKRKVVVDESKNEVFELSVGKSDEEVYNDLDSFLDEELNELHKY